MSLIELLFYPQTSESSCPTNDEPSASAGISKSAPTTPTEEKLSRPKAVVLDDV